MGLRAGCDVRKRTDWVLAEDELSTSKVYLFHRLRQDHNGNFRENGGRAGTTDKSSQSDVSFSVPFIISRANLPRLYCKNLPDKLQKADLRRSLYLLFATYGPILDIVALKTPKMRGQAHIVFRDVQASTQAMRALQGFEFFGKEMVGLCFIPTLLMLANSNYYRTCPMLRANRSLFRS